MPRHSAACQHSARVAVMVGRVLFSTLKTAVQEGGATARSASLKHEARESKASQLV